jgi:DNA-binding CsgD family transcriptional regulator/PAS domain-containing protein
MSAAAHKTELFSPQRPVRRAAPADADRSDTTGDDIEPGNLSGLVAAIYDAALAPEKWPSVLDACRLFVGGMSASLFAKDAAGLAGGIFHTDGHMDPAYGRLYFDRYARLDPATGGHLLTPLEEPVGTADLMDLDEFRASRFYREWAEPQGIVDFVSAPIEKAGGWAAMFGVFRDASHGMTDDVAKDRMRLLVPHIRRAVVIGKVVERSHFEAASLGDAFDGLAVGMFLIGADGRVVHANAAGEAMYGGGAINTTRDGRIVTAGPEATKALAEVFAAAGKGDAAVGVRGISVALPGADGENYVAHVLPLTSGIRRNTGIRYAAVAAMFVQRAALAIPAAPEVIARTFGLTISELRVMNAIVQVGGVLETADALGIAEATVKSHLHKVFAKTGTARQADLVRLAAGFASPLAV